MSEEPKPRTAAPPIEDRAANVLNFILGGMILLTVIAFGILAFGDLVWRAGGILKRPPADWWGEASKGLLGLLAAVYGLKLLIGLVRRALAARRP